MKIHPYFLAGEWKTDGTPFAVVNPYNGLKEYECFEPPAESVESAIASLERSFLLTRKLPTWKRSEILAQIASGIRERRSELADTICIEAGKPIRFALAEVDRAATTFALASQFVNHWKGEILPLDISPQHEGLNGYVKRFPIGPLLAITPFNFPLNLVAHKVAPAIAAGNPVMIKPATRTPVTALKLTEIIAKTDWPAEAISTLPCFPELTGNMVKDERFRKMSFTGSQEVGWYLKSIAGKKKVTLELGGDAAVIIDRSADLHSAAKKCALGAFAYAGQICISVQRIFIQQEVYNPFMELLHAEMANMKTGNPAEEDVVVGPMIDRENVKRISTWVEEAVKDGAGLAGGGVSDDERIYFPAILSDVPGNCKLARNEAFAPVIIVEQFKEFNEAISKVNASPFGLQAGIFSDSQSNIKSAYRDLNVGGLIINHAPGLRIDNMPYGGIKDSGFGREGIEYALAEMTELKLMVW